MMRNLSTISLCSTAFLSLLLDSLNIKLWLFCRIACAPLNSLLCFVHTRTHRHTHRHTHPSISTIYLHFLSAAYRQLRTATFVKREMKLGWRRWRTRIQTEQRAGDTNRRKKMGEANFPCNQSDASIAQPGLSIQHAHWRWELGSYSGPRAYTARGYILNEKARSVSITQIFFFICFILLWVCLLTRNIHINHNFGKILKMIFVVIITQYNRIFRKISGPRHAKPSGI